MGALSSSLQVTSEILSIDKLRSAYTKNLLLAADFFMFFRNKNHQEI